MQKLNYPEYIELINVYDFICLSESKTDDFDSIHIPGYTFNLKNRKPNPRVKSGGIAFGYKSQYDKYVHPIETSSKLVSWYKISSSLFKSSEDIIIGNVYIPPENSSYKVIDALNELEEEFLRLSVNHKFILLNGDFNSRTGMDSDFIELIDDDRNPANNVINYAGTLEQFDMSYIRSSKDTFKNNYGNQLLQLCKNNNLFILNGRVNGDKIGMFTCRQSSVVDYFLCTYDMLGYIISLHVLEFSSLYSDVHSPVALNVNFKIDINELDEKELSNGKCDIKKIKKWNIEKEEDFKNSIDMTKVEQLEYELNLVNINDLSHAAVSDLIDSLNSLLVNSAEQVFGSYIKQNYTKNSNKKENKPWFTDDCWKKRKSFRISKKRYKNCKTRERKELMKSQEKAYKREMNKAIHEHRRNMRTKLKNLKSKNSKEFWNILNTKENRKKPDIPTNIFYEFFKELNSANAEEDELPALHVNAELNEIINDDITECEIYKCIKGLKNGKASGDDLIINEYIKSTSRMLMPIYVKLFNIIFNTGNVPETWLVGNIIPFYKNKGEKCDPKNYRPITILSCLGKLFTSVLNNRLNDFVENSLLLNENQSGFRNGYSTTDSILSLHFLFELLKLKKKKLYCAFIDFAKAFDTVWRPGLWSKLLKTSINGKMYDVIVNMYSNIKSRVFNGCEHSDFFPCEVGVRQGENLSPLLFSLYVNDLEDFLQSKNIVGLKSISDEIESELNLFLKLFTILYADDTVLLSESPTDLQKQLDSLNNYCNIWKLKVNVDKSKIVIFSKGRLPNNMSFKYNDINIDIVSEFTYLGVLLSRSGSFAKAKKANAEKATRAMYDILRKGRIHNLSIECQLDLFDKVIQPILLYGCEVWGTGNNSIIERVHLKFCKLLMHGKKSTPDFMVYGELGRYPLDIFIKLRIIKYWTKLVLGKQEKLPSVLYNLALRKYQNNVTWLKYVKSILDVGGLSYVWNNQYALNPNWLYCTIKQNLTDQFRQLWLSDLQNSPKSLNYRIYKEDYKLEDYFKILDDKNIITFCRFRTLNHKLPIESGRWQNINRENRKCLLCNTNNIGDEFHYIFTCCFFHYDRKKLLKAKYINRPNAMKFKELMNSKNPSDLNNLCKFIRIVNKKLNSPG